MKKYSPFWLLAILLVTIFSTWLIWDWSTGKCRIQLGLDLRSGSHIAVQLLPITTPTGEVIKIDKKVQEQSIQVFQKRLNPDGTQEIVVTPEGQDRLIIEIPGVTNLQQAESMVKKAARLEFREQSFNPEKATAEWKTVMDGSMITRAVAQPAQGGKGWEVNFELSTKGAMIFGEVTRRLVGKPLGIFFDGKMISSPVVQNPITGGSGVITGLEGHTSTGDDKGKELTGAEEATELANFLNAGALPVDVKILESYTVSPTLGAESLKYSLVSGILGLAMVCVYMMGYYRVPGITASVALVVYSLLTLGSMNIPGLEFVLTLPGIAGFILSIGMAVDANVLIFERIKEELWDGKSLTQAVQTGFGRAWSSIFDGHVTTAVGAGILYYFGSASVKGFGLTLLIGTAWSIITATFVTRNFIDFAVGGLGLKNPKSYGA